MSNLGCGVIVSQEATNRGILVATGLLPDADAMNHYQVGELTEVN
ncbi:hypothetical protein [Vibrio sp. 10N]|nr:hypothetical protein VB10N_32470 [Vibrio sp. 10N]